MRKLRFLFLALPLLAACTPFALTPSTQQTGTSSEIASSSLSPIDSQRAVAVLPFAYTSGSLLEIGKSTAPLTLIAFTNPSCSYCKEFFEQDVPRLQTDFVAPSTLHLEIAILPMKKYPESEREMRTLFCAAAQGKGMVMHDALFSLPKHSETATLSAAKSLGLDLPKLTTCLSSPAASAAVQEQESLALHYGVTLAPTLILQEEKKIGLQPYADLRAWIQHTQKR